MIRSLNKFVKYKVNDKFNKLISLFIYLSIGVLIFSCLKYIFYGSINWDEPFHLRSIETHLKFAYDLITFKGRDYSEIESNMEWYGIALKLIYTAPMLIFKKLFFEDNQFIQFTLLRITALFIYILFGLFLYKNSNLYQDKKSKILLLIYFIFPYLAGESYLNITDIPFAICFSLYSLFNGIFTLIKNSESINKKLNKYPIKRIRFIWNNKRKTYLLSILMAAFLINSKASMIAPVIIIEIFLAIYISQKSKSTYGQIKNIICFSRNKIFYILASTYLITPAAWLNPFRYYPEVIKNFSKFTGNFESKINGTTLVTNTENWSLIEYLFRWFQIKIPIIMFSLLILLFLFTIYEVLFKKEKFKNKLDNPILVFYFLQLTLTPLLAIVANSSSYNSLRHWTFVFPPLIIFSAYVVDNYLLVIKNSIFHLISKFIIIIFSILGITDNILMMPYINLSFNGYGRKVVEFENTEIDYWGYTSGELIKNKVSKSYEIRSYNPSFRSYGENAPHHIKQDKRKSPFAYATNYKKTDFLKRNCNNFNYVSRNLLFRRKPLNFSKVGICPVYSGNYWKIWSSESGKVKIESLLNKNFLNLSDKFNILDLKRLKLKKPNILSLLFINNDKYILETVSLNKDKILNSSFEIPTSDEISNYLSNYEIPKIAPYRYDDYLLDWELGLNVEEANPKVFFNINNLKLVSIDDKYVGVICKRKNKRSIKVILKNKDSTFIHKPYGKSGDFEFVKAECLYSKNGELEKIFLYDANEYITYKWEINSQGFFQKSEIVPSINILKN